MKISSVNSFNYNQKQQNFNGLWSKTVSHAPDYDPVIGTTKKVEISYYHPFLDETDLEITDVVNKNCSSRIVKGDDSRRQLLIRECKVCAPVLTTKDKYNQYLNLNNLADFTDDHRTTHVSVKDKFTNSGFSSDQNNLKIEQQSAVNQTITEALSRQINTFA